MMESGGLKRQGLWEDKGNEIAGGILLKDI